MSDLISKKALLEALKNNGTYLLPDGADESDYIYYSEAVDLITNAPAIEQPQTVKDALEKVAKLCFAGWCIWRRPQLNYAPEDEICPVCGYYCLGKGGMGCVDKPNMTKGLDYED